MFAIRNKKDKRWVYGTDYRNDPPKQRLSTERAILCKDKESALLEMKLRRVNSKRYEVVEVELKVKEG
ncbi:hypothetical protein ACQUEF_01725 [Vagococcus fluvialis]|uniref:hypothetical protein n=1 Tax=Vagococcus fluvialis TaxID=2738 RepID=UPI003D11A7DA